MVSMNLQKKLDLNVSQALQFMKIKRNTNHVVEILAQLV